MITDCGSNVVSGFVACKQCDTLLAFESREIDVTSEETAVSQAAAMTTQEHHPHSLCDNHDPSPRIIRVISIWFYIITII